MASSAAGRAEVSIRLLFPRLAPLKHTEPPSFQIGTPGRWNDASIRSRSEAPWGHPVDRPRRSRPPDKPGASFRKGYPFSGGVFRLFTSQEFAAPDLISYSGSRGEDPCSVDFYHPRTEFGSRSSIRRGCRDWLWLWRRSPRT